MRSSRVLLLSLAAACVDDAAAPPVSPPGDHPKQVGRPPSRGSGPASAPGSRPGPSDGKAPTTFAGISGTIRLGEGIGPGDVGAEDVVFVMARTAEGGQLVAVELLSDLSFPMTFHLDAADVMSHGAPPEPPFRVSARLDRDQDALTKSVKDLYALHEEPVDGGAEGLVLTLQRASLPPSTPTSSP